MLVTEGKFIAIFTLVTDDNFISIFMLAIEGKSIAIFMLVTDRQTDLVEEAPSRSLKITNASKVHHYYMCIHYWCFEGFFFQTLINLTQVVSHIFIKGKLMRC